MNLQLFFPGFPEPRKKTFPLLVSKYFLSGHPNAGKPTYFKEAILSGEKIHTVRANPLYWEPIVSKVQQGIGVISLRQWDGKPYRSKAVEFAQITTVGSQRFNVGLDSVISIDHKPINGSFDITQFAKNDGLGYDDFRYWFNLHRPGSVEFSGCIIHFTDFKYSL